MDASIEKIKVGLSPTPHGDAAGFFNRRMKDYTGLRQSLLRSRLQPQNDGKNRKLYTPEPGEDPEIFEGQLAWPEFPDHLETGVLYYDGSKPYVTILGIDPVFVGARTLFDLDAHNGREAKKLSMDHGHVLSIQFCLLDNPLPLQSKYHSFLIYSPYRRTPEGLTTVLDDAGTVVPIQNPDNPVFDSPQAAKEYLETVPEYRDDYNSIHTKLVQEDRNVC